MFLNKTQILDPRLLSLSICDIKFGSIPQTKKHDMVTIIKKYDFDHLLPVRYTNITDVYVTGGWNEPEGFFRRYRV